MTLENLKLVNTLYTNQLASSTMYDNIPLVKVVDMACEGNQDQIETVLKAISTAVGEADGASTIIDSPYRRIAIHERWRGRLKVAELLRNLIAKEATSQISSLSDKKEVPLYNNSIYLYGEEGLIDTIYPDKKE